MRLEDAPPCGPPLGRIPGFLVIPGCWVGRKTAERSAISRPSVEAHALRSLPPVGLGQRLRPCPPGLSSESPLFSPFSVPYPLGGLCVHPTLGGWISSGHGICPSCAFARSFNHLLTSAETRGYLCLVWVMAQ